MRCKYRKPARAYLYSSTGDDCYAIFDVIRFFKQQFICYQLVNRDRSLRYEYVDIIGSLQTPGLYFQISLDGDKFLHIAEFQATIHDANLQPRGNRAFSLPMSRTALTVPMPDGGKPYDVKYEEFGFTYVAIINERLKPPYKTNCKDYEQSPFQSQDDCIDSCMIDGLLKDLNKIPFSAVVDTVYKKYHISSEDNKQQVTKNATLWWKSRCAHECRQMACKERLYVTFFVKGGDSDHLTMSTYAMSKPLIFVRFRASMLFEQFLVQFLSVFGIWFSVDFTTLIPVFAGMLKVMGLCIRYKF